MKYSLIAFIIILPFLATNCEDINDLFRAKEGPGNLPPFGNIEVKLRNISNETGLRLLSALDSINNKSGNLLISPVSIQMAMGMALTGSDGATEKEMKQILGWGGDSLSVILDSYLNTLKTLEGKAYNGTEFYIVIIIIIRTKILK